MIVGGRVRTSAEPLHRLHRGALQHRAVLDAVRSEREHLMASAGGKSADAEQIRALVDGWARDVRAKDVGGSVSGYAPDVVVFDVVDPLRYVGLDAVRKRLEQWFASFRGPLGYEVRDLTIAAGEDVAFCHSLNHVSGTLADGRGLDMWWRATLCLRGVDGKWMVTHSHSSVPFNPESGGASLGLEP